jgi:hypothetical protein
MINELGRPGSDESRVAFDPTIECIDMAELVFQQADEFLASIEFRICAGEEMKALAPCMKSS